MTAISYARRHARLIRATYATLAIVVAAWAVLIGYARYTTVIDEFPHDAHIDYGGAKVVMDGKNPYTVEGLRSFNLSLEKGLGHPPTVLVWFLPFTKLSLHYMKVAWNELTILLLFLMVLLAVYDLRLPAPPATVALVFALAIATTWMTDHLRVSQVSTLVAFLMTVSWYFLRRDEDTLAGIALGLACTAKFYPGTVVILLFFSGRFRVAIVAGVVFVLWAAAITWRIGTVHCWLDFLEQAKPYTTHWGAHIRNGSIQGVIQRLKHPVCEGLSSSVYEMWAPGATAAAALSIGLFAYCWYIGRTAVQKGSTCDLPFALFVVVSMITGPYTWEHYNVTLVVPLLIAVVALYKMRGQMSPIALCAGVLLWFGIVYILGIDIHIKETLWKQFYPDKSVHFRLHLYEVLGWISPSLTMLLLSALLHNVRRRGSAAIAPLTFDPVSHT